MDSTEATLIAEQLGRLTDRITARLDAIEERQCHAKELGAEQAEAIKADLTDIKAQLADHETRLRAVQAETTTSKVILGLTGGGSSILSAIAFFKSIIGGGP